MALLYQVDFSSLANQAITQGANTIDGLVWYAKGPSNAGGLTWSRSVVNGTGLQLGANNIASIGSNGDLDFNHFFLPLANIPQWNSSQALMVRGRFAYSASNFTLTGLIGFADSTSDGTGLRAALRAKDHFAGPAYTSTVTTSVSYKQGGNAMTSGAGRTSAISNQECAPGVLNDYVLGFGLHGSEHSTSGIPSSVNSFLPAAAAGGGDPNFQYSSRANPGVFFGVNAGIGLPWTIALRWLRIDVIGELQDTTPPVVTLVSPTEMTKLRRFDRLTFDVTGSTFHIVSCIYDHFGIVEEAIDSEDPTLATMYSWTRSAISGGYRYVLFRRGGWPAPPRLRVRATDGNIA
jgi:hypothetical protein